MSEKSATEADIFKFPTEIGKLPVPCRIISFFDWLLQRGFSVWIVGGVIRDYLNHESPKDWDIATDAPYEVLEDSGYRVVPVGARFGIVDVLIDSYVVEVANIKATSQGGNIESDLERRDFTINAMAIEYPSGKLLDFFGGRRDLKFKRLRAVKDAEKRFSEDPLRILRGARFVSQYGFHIVPSTFTAMKSLSRNLSSVAVERIRDEMFRIITGSNVFDAIEILRKAKALEVFFPELLEGWRKKQNEFHKFSIYYHILHTVSVAPPRLKVRLAALLHDIGKPRVRIKKDGKFRFYGHEKESERMARDILLRWKAPFELIEDVCKLVRNHMAYDFSKWSDAAIRRLISRLGEHLVDDFVDLVKADRVAHGFSDKKGTEEIEDLRRRINKQIEKYRLFSIRDLAVNGRDVMNVLKINEGPEVGQVLRYLYNHVLNRPQDNKREILVSLMLAKFSKPDPGR